MTENLEIYWAAVSHIVRFANFMIMTYFTIRFVYTIQWDVDSLDWKDYGADSIVKKVVQNDKLQNGSIILMHNGAKYTKDALDAVINGLKEQGYEIVPVSKLIYKKDYHMDVTGRQIAN